jgi:hypothetical protein
MLPRVRILFENGALGAVLPSPDGVLGILCTGVAVSEKFSLNTPYIVKRFEELEDVLGITTANNRPIVDLFTDIFAVAPSGSEFWLMGFANTVTLAEMVDVTEANTAKSLLLAANGRIRGLIVTRTPASGYDPTIDDGLDEDVYQAMVNANVLGEWAADTLFAPVFTILEGRSFTGDPIDLADLTTTSYNRVGIFIGSDESSTSDFSNESIGLLAGRIANIPVQRNIGRVKDGALPLLNAYIRDKKVELADVGSIHDKGFITFRTFVGKTGYYFTDDPLAAAITDDYRSLAARRTIDKAYRICYSTLLEELLDEIPVNEDGTMQAAMVKNWQGKVENAIALQMTANGELSADVTDPKDRGVECLIDEKQNVVSTSKVVVYVRVRPFGYSRYIDVYLGFKTVTT